jgi:MFS family permease
LVRRRELWGSCLGGFCDSYALYFVLSWLPLYLVKARGFSMAQMAQTGAAVYDAAALTSILTGWVSDHWLRVGAGTNRVRMSALVTGLAGVGGCFGSCAVAGPGGSLYAMFGCGIFLGIFTQAYFASVQTLAGPNAAARWFGVQNFVGALAGIIGPVVTGVVVDRTGSFAYAFLIAAGLAIMGALAFALIVGRIEPLAWHPDPPRLGRAKVVRRAAE